MFLLPFLEEKLGAVALWPSYVLRLLFVEATSLLGVTSLAAFFHGNGIPMNAAISFHLTCHGYDDVAFITRIIQNCYDEWNGPSVVPVQYYILIWKRGYSGLSTARFSQCSRNSPLQGSTLASFERPTWNAD
jgi:hypothetical protein